jgi:UDP-glucose 4-epimerase
MKFLVTGGNGFIGSNVVDALIEAGHEVIVIDNLSSDAHDNFYYNEKARASFKFCITNIKMCHEIFEGFKPDYVFHFAAEARIQNCNLNPTKAYETNLMGTLNMLELSRNHKVKRFIFSSTSAIYGLKNSPFEPNLLNEEMVPDCLNAYSLSKLSAEQACKMYSDLYGLSTVCLRYFNVYGPHQPKRGSYAPVIGIFSRQLKNNEKMTIVGDGNQTRDYVHVSDVVNANLLAALSEIDLKGDVFNVGSGKSFSVLELAKMMQGEYTFLPERVGEARHTLADITKIKQYFEWEPKKSLKEYMENKEYDN